MRCHPTQMKNSKGQTIRVFSASDYSTVDVHVKWMKDYGLAGCTSDRQQNLIDRAYKRID
jgi:hypothetical protein